MDLKTARFLTNKSQLEIEAATGVFQTLLSRFEKNGIECLNKEEKKRIEKYLRFRINWNPEVQTEPPLTKEEQNEIKPFLEQIKARRGEKRTLEWMASFKTGRELYNGVMDIINNTIVQIPMPQMKWEKEKVK